MEKELIKKAENSSIYDAATILIKALKGNKDKETIHSLVDVLLKHIDRIDTSDGIYFPISELYENRYYSECIELCKKKLEKSECSKNMEYIHFRMGECYMKLKDLKSAKKEFELARSDEDFTEEVDMYLSDIYIMTRDDDIDGEED